MKRFLTVLFLIGFVIIACKKEKEVVTEYKEVRDTVYLGDTIVNEIIDFSRLSLKDTCLHDVCFNCNLTPRQDSLYEVLLNGYQKGSPFDLKEYVEEWYNIENEREINDTTRLLDSFFEKYGFEESVLDKPIIIRRNQSFYLDFNFSVDSLSNSYGKPKFTYTYKKKRGEKLYVMNDTDYAKALRCFRGYNSKDCYSNENDIRHDYLLDSIQDRHNYLLYYLNIYSDNLRRGCGYPGSYIAGFSFNETLDYAIIKISSDYDSYHLYKLNVDKWEFVDNVTENTDLEYLIYKDMYLQ